MRGGYAQRHAAPERRSGRPDGAITAAFPAELSPRHKRGTAAGSGTGKALLARHYQPRGCRCGSREPAALPWPVAERNELEALRKSAPAIRNILRPPPARAADRPTPTVQFCIFPKMLQSGSPPDILVSARVRFPRSTRQTYCAAPRPSRSRIRAMAPCGGTCCESRQPESSRSRRS